MYKCITGVTPIESISRVRTDELKPPSALGIDVEPAREKALMQGMAALQENRFQSVRAMYNALYDSATVYIPQPVSTVTPAAQPETTQSAVQAQTAVPAQAAAQVQPRAPVYPPVPAGPPQVQPFQHTGKSKPQSNPGKPKIEHIIIAAIAGVCLITVLLVMIYYLS
jgi:hypothetical protein